MHKTKEYWQLIEELRDIRTAESDIADMLREFPLDHVIDRNTFEFRVRARLDAVRPGTTEREMRVALFRLGCAGLVCAVAPDCRKYVIKGEDKSNASNKAACCSLASYS